MTDANLLADLRTEEGFSLVAYPDPLSHGAPWTIGYGHTGGVHPGDKISKAEGEALLQADRLKAEAALDASIPWWRGLNDARQDVIVDMAFNLGVAKLTGFNTFLRLVRTGDYKAAAQDGLHTAWAIQVHRRAHRLMAQMALGEHTT